MPDSFPPDKLAALELHLNNSMESTIEKFLTDHGMIQYKKIAANNMPDVIADFLKSIFDNLEKNIDAGKVGSVGKKSVAKKKAATPKKAAPAKKATPKTKK